MIVIIDGPEAAGKTTLITDLWKRVPDLKVRHWGLIESWHEYESPLAKDIREGGPIVWDRSWAAEVCYNDLMKRGRKISEGEIDERLEAVVKNAGGLRIMLLPPVPVLEARRLIRRAAGETDDLDCEPARERFRFVKYAKVHGWTMLQRDIVQEAAIVTIAAALRRK